jgi:hypothetical protein
VRQPDRDKQSGPSQSQGERKCSLQWAIGFACRSSRGEVVDAGLATKNVRIRATGHVEAGQRCTLAKADNQSRDRYGPGASLLPVGCFIRAARALVRGESAGL